MTSPSPSDERSLEDRFQTTVAHPARVYDVWLGGKDNFEADRIAARQVIEAQPGILFGVRANRAFLARTVRYLAGECGIRQFLDIGTGIPTRNNTHEVAQFFAEESRVVYVNNDPIVLAHARALLASGPHGATAYVDADLRDPDTILAEATRTLDFTQPVAIMLLLILHLIPDKAGPYRIVARLLDGGAARQLPGHLPPGQRHPGQRVRRGRPALQPVRQHPADPAHPRRGHPVLHRARHHRARDRATAPVAPRPRHRRPARTRYPATAASARKPRCLKPA